MKPGYHHFYRFLGDYGSFFLTMLKIDLENLIIARYLPQINLFCVYRSRWGGYGCIDAN